MPPPAMDQNHAPLPAKPAIPKPPSKEKLVKDAYQRLKTMKVSDITMNLHEHLKNLDAAWLKRILPSIVGEYMGCFNGTACPANFSAQFQSSMVLQSKPSQAAVYGMAPVAGAVAAGAAACARACARAGPVCRLLMTLMLLAAGGAAAAAAVTKVAQMKIG